MKSLLKRASDKVIFIRTSLPVVAFYLHYILYNTPLNNNQIVEPYFKFEVFSIFYLTVVVFISIVNGLSNGRGYFWISLLAVPAMIAGLAMLGFLIFIFLITFGEGLSV